jgi:hypothetical protein
VRVGHDRLDPSDNDTVWRDGNDNDDNNNDDNNTNNNCNTENNIKNNDNSTAANNNNKRNHHINTPYTSADAETIDIDNDACAYGVVCDSHRHQFATTAAINVNRGDRRSNCTNNDNNCYYYHSY